nr:SIMPL domain-containing protein [Nitrobacter winogradskyi]
MQNRIPLAIAIAIATTTALIPLAAQADTPPPMISVTGEATISTPPDLAQIEAGVTTDAKTAREASEANNAAMSKVLAALKSAGIPEKDFQTSRLSLQPQYTNPNRSSPSVLSGYRATNRVAVKLRDISKLAGVIDTVTAAGANDIGGINFAVSNASKLLDDARAEAVADARRKAEIYAKAAGVSLGAPLSISEHGSSAPVMYRRAAMPMAAEAAIAPGEETLRVTVGISWEIKAAP